MADDDTELGVDETQPEEAPAKADAAKDAPGAQDEVSLLRSRYAGQTAKVTELQTAKAALQAERDALRAERDALKTGEVNKDEALKALLAAKDEEIAQVRRETALARIEAKYPETFAELGEVTASFSEEKLASLEARLLAKTDQSDDDEEEGDTPTPRRNNPSRRDGGSGGAAKPESSADILARLKTMTPNW